MQDSKSAQLLEVGVGGGVAGPVGALGAFPISGATAAYASWMVVASAKKSKFPCPLLTRCRAPLYPTLVCLRYPGEIETWSQRPEGSSVCVQPYFTVPSARIARSPE